MTLLEVDPDLVRPGWTPMVVVLLLGLVLFLLGRSMLKQFGKIDVPADHDPADRDPAAPSAEPPAAAGGPVGTAGTAGDLPFDRGKPGIPDLRSGTTEAGADSGPPGPR